MEKRSLISYFEELSDKRRAEGKRHKMSLILTLVVMATLTENYGFRGTLRFTVANKEELIRVLQVPKERLPSLTTIYRTVSQIDFDEFAKLFKSWAMQYGKLSEADVLSIDGKSLCNTVTNYSNAYQNFVSIVSVYSQKTNLILDMQKYESKKSSEISIVNDLVQNLGIEGVIFTLDALHANKKNSNHN